MISSMTTVFGPSARGKFSTDLRLRLNSATQRAMTLCERYESLNVEKKTLIDKTSFQR